MCRAMRELSIVRHQEFHRQHEPMCGIGPRITDSDQIPTRHDGHYRVEISEHIQEIPSHEIGGKVMMHLKLETGLSEDGKVEIPRIVKDYVQEATE